MQRLLLVVVVVLLVLVLLAAVAPPALAARVLFIAPDSRIPTDVQMYDRAVTLGHVVTWCNVSTFTNASIIPGAYDVVFICESIGSDSVRSQNVEMADVGLFNLESYLLRNRAGEFATCGDTSGNVGGYADLTITDEVHAITAGRTRGEIVTLFSSVPPVSVSCIDPVAADATVLGEFTLSTIYKTPVCVERGSVDLAARVAPQRRVVFPLFQGDWARVTPAAVEMFDRGLAWAADSNDAPTIAVRAPLGVFSDTPLSVSAVLSAFSFADADSVLYPTFGGIAILACDDGGGGGAPGARWEVSPGGSGGPFQPCNGSMLAATGVALQLDDTAEIRFAAAGGGVPQPSPSLVFKAWDRTNFRGSKDSGSVRAIPAGEVGVLGAYSAGNGTLVILPHTDTDTMPTRQPTSQPTPRPSTTARRASVGPTSPTPTAPTRTTPAPPPTRASATASAPRPTRTDTATASGTASAPSVPSATAPSFPSFPSVTADVSSPTPAPRFLFWWLWVAAAVLVCLLACVAVVVFLGVWRRRRGESTDGNGEVSVPSTPLAQHAQPPPPTASPTPAQSEYGCVFPRQLDAADDDEGSSSELEIIYADLAMFDGPRT